MHVGAVCAAALTSALALAPASAATIAAVPTMAGAASPASASILVLRLALAHASNAPPVAPVATMVFSATEASPTLPYPAPVPSPGASAACDGSHDAVAGVAAGTPVEMLTILSDASAAAAAAT